MMHVLLSGTGQERHFSLGPRGKQGDRPWQTGTAGIADVNWVRRDAFALVAANLSIGLPTFLRRKPMFVGPSS